MGRCLRHRVTAGVMDAEGAVNATDVCDARRFRRMRNSGRDLQEAPGAAAGTAADSTPPRLATTELRIAGAAATRGAFVLVTEIDPAFGQIVNRQFQRHAVARENTDVVLAHAAGRVSANHNTIIERNAITAIRKYFVDDTVKFKQFFFRHA
jgi:hypothetical protein